MVETKTYGLADRTFNFAKEVRSFLKVLPSTTTNCEDIKQLLRSSGSVGANFIEAKEALSKKDFIYRLKICRKEALESRYWLKLLDASPIENTKKIELVQEAKELTHIFGSIISKSDF